MDNNNNNINNNDNDNINPLLPASRRPAPRKRVVKTQDISPEPKKIGGQGHGNGGLSRLRDKHKNVYNKELNQEVLGGETAAKSGAAGVAGDVLDAYKDAAIRQAKIQAMDELLEFVGSSVPVPAYYKLLERIPAFKSMIQAKQKKLATSVVAAVLPAPLAYIAENVKSEKTANGLLNVASTLIDISARDGVKVSKDFLAPRFAKMFALFVSDVPKSDK